MTRTTNARLAGLAYLCYIVVGITNEILMGRMGSADGSAARLAQVAAHAADLRVSILLKLCECFAALVLAVTLYGITRNQDNEVAMLGLVCRVGEGLFVANLIPNDLSLLWVAQADAATANALGPFLLLPMSPIGSIFFAVGSTAFSWLLLRGRMIPAPLGWWGVLSSLLLVAGLPLQLAGFVTGPVTQYQWVPAILFAPTLALWLLIKGVAKAES